MNRYIVRKRYVQKDGTLGKITDTYFADGLDRVRHLCGGKLHRSRNLSIEHNHAVYVGRTEKFEYMAEYVCIKR